MGVWRNNKMIDGRSSVLCAQQSLLENVAQLQRQIDAEVLSAIGRFYRIPAGKAIKSGLCEVRFNAYSRFHMVEDLETMVTICRWGMLDGNSVMDWNYPPHLKQTLELQFHAFDSKVSGKLFN